MFHLGHLIIRFFKGNWREFRDIKNDEEAVGIHLQAKISKTKYVYLSRTTAKWRCSYCQMSDNKRKDLFLSRVEGLFLSIRIQLSILILIRIKNTIFPKQLVSSI